MKKNIFCAIALLALMFTSFTVAQTPKKVDLRTKIATFNLPVKAQGGRNTCSIYTTVFLLEYETAKASNQTGLDFSEDYLDAVTDIVDGTKEDGDYFNNVLGGYLKYGTVDESDFLTTAVYNVKNIPSETVQNDGKNNIKFIPVFIRENPGGDNPWGLTDEHINQIIAQLDAGRPVAAGWRLALGGKIENAKVLGINAWSKNAFKDAKDFTGHSMPIVGYAKGTASEGGYFIIRNTSGSSWGDKGYWYCTFDFAKQNIADAFYFKPKTRSIAVQMPQMVKKPVPRYIKVKALQNPIIALPKTNMNLPKN